MAAIGIIVTEFGTITIDDTASTTVSGGGSFTTILPPGVDIPIGASLTYKDASERYIMLPLIFQTINAQLSSMNLGFMRDAILEVKERASNPNQGIYTSAVCSTCEDERALLMASLNRSGDLPSILDEKTNPSPPTDFYPAHGEDGNSVSYPGLGISSGSTNTSGTSSSAGGTTSGGSTGGSIVIGPA